MKFTFITPSPSDLVNVSLNRGSRPRATPQTPTFVIGAPTRVTSTGIWTEGGKVLPELFRLILFLFAGTFMTDSF